MSDGLFFLGVLFFFFLLWFVSGGPTRPISFAGPYITPITDVGDEQVGYDDPDGIFEFVRGGSSPSPSASSNGWSWSGWGGGQDAARDLQNAEDELRRLEGAAADARAFGDPSPYRDQVEIVSVAPSTERDQEYVTVQARSSASGPVTISGWRVKSDASGKYATIPYGSELPRSGLNTTSSIVLYPGERAILSTGSSPVGVSFRENMCTGYFAEREEFTPYLGGSCPTPLDEFERFYSGNKLDDDTCYAFVSGARSCTAVTDTPAYLTSACEDLVDGYLYYGGCVAAHRYESRFRGTTWRVYLERGSSLWKSSREAVKLLDQNGKTVDLYTY
ncbi:MAG TPA: hypothetical protein VHO23_00070 [Candidatus Paceibacterota bacterium]|nr:hypothetical protein [Candidatus Paceibacterota bacterium]